MTKVKESEQLCGSTQSYSDKANFVQIDHGDGDVTLYTHLAKDSVIVGENQRVRAYEKLGVSGKTGRTSCGNHLHYQVQQPCGASSGFCQSVESSFQDDDVQSQRPDGIPRTGDDVESDNHVPWADVFSRKSDATWNTRKGLRAGGWSSSTLASGLNLDFDEAHVGFYDGDPHSDLFFYDPAGGAGDRKVWLSDGSGDFTSVSMSAWNAYGYDIYPGDFNADGLTDIFRYRQSDGKRALFYSDGDGTFTARDPQYSSNWDAGHLLAVVDFDGDGDDDIFMYDPDDADRILKENDDGEGHFHQENAGGSNWPTDAVPFAGNFKTPLGIVDLGSYKASNGRVDTYESSGAGSFIRIRQDTFESGRVPYAGFFDGDFLTDLILYEEDDGDWTSRYSNGSSSWTAGENGDWESARTLGVGDYQLS